MLEKRIKDILIFVSLKMELEKKEILLTREKEGR